MQLISLEIKSLSHLYQTGKINPEIVITQIYDRIQRYDDRAVWIYLAPLERSLQRARELRDKNPELLPLYGIPFAIKDNIDWADAPTTAGCPAYSYQPQESATVVDRLIAAGAIPIGKTNLDQFATGLVGTRSPYGICRNTFNAEYIAGGSSSGSAVAVAAGLVSFALGTDTAGSGRVPAAFNNIVGLKPTKGHLSTSGLVPAVRSLDCISIFTLTCEDAEAVLRVTAGFDDRDPFSRRAENSEISGQRDRRLPDILANGLRVGVPQGEQLEFFGNKDSEKNYYAAIDRLQNIGCEIVSIDLQPFRETASLLYAGTWVAERTAAVGDFMRNNPDAVDSIVAAIITKGDRYSAVDVYRDSYKLMELKRQAKIQWQQMDILALPTAGTIYKVEEITASPFDLNSNLGIYTNFVNLLDLSAIAVPSGFQSNGLPTGITLIARAWQDIFLCRLGGLYHRNLGGNLGATGVPLSPPSTIAVAVVGAHLTGQPLNYQLLEEDGKLLRSCKTAPIYRLYALAGKIAKPGLIRQTEGGSAIEVEVWELPAAGFGRFVSLIPSPLGIGTLVLEDGTEVKGFLCEPHAVSNAPDISHLGGWRAYLAGDSV